MWEALVSSHVLSKFRVLIEPGMNKKGIFDKNADSSWAEHELGPCKSVFEI